MKKTLNVQEQYYRTVIFSIGVTMIWFLLLMNLLGLLLSVLQPLTESLPISKVAADVIYQLSYAAGYLLVFMLPVVFLKRSLKKRGVNYHAMKTQVRLSPYLPAIVLGGMVLIWSQSYINAAMVSIFNYSEFSAEMLWEQNKEYTAYQLVLQFIVIAVVPAFCEEFLFRGAILTNLLPFGRGNAILISSLLFAVMHQNAEQILYAFAAGLLLGTVYERTDSIWNCVLLHLINNFSSFALGIIAKKLHSNAELAGALLETLLGLAGMACIVALVKSLSPKKPDFEKGIFGKTLPASDSYASCPVSARQSVRLFFCFPMVLFFVFAAVQIVTLIGMSVVFSYGS